MSDRAAPSSSPTPPAPPAPAAPRHVSLLGGDRLCTRCAYNLVGQPVVREEHYAMLIVRCPECGAVASLQEYPLLGRWVGRWTALAAALWLLAMLILVVITGVTIASGSSSFTNAGSYELAVRLARDQRSWLLEQPEGSIAGYEWLLNAGDNPFTSVHPTWAAQVMDPEAALDAGGGWWAVIDFDSALRAIWSGAFFIVPLGCIWAVAALHLRRWRLLTLAPLLVAVAAIFVVLAHQAMRVGWGAQVLQHIASAELAVPLNAMFLAFALLCLVAGLLIGRPLTRWLVRWLLPPRLRGPLAVLWTVDGLKP